MQIFTNGGNVLTNNMRKNAHECVHMDDACAQTMHAGMFAWKEHDHKPGMCSYGGNMFIETRNMCSHKGNMFTNQECHGSHRGNMFTCELNVFTWRELHVH